MMPERQLNPQHSMAVSVPIYEVRVEQQRSSRTRLNFMILACSWKTQGCHRNRSYVAELLFSLRILISCAIASLSSIIILASCLVYCLDIVTSDSDYWLLYCSLGSVVHFIVKLIELIESLIFSCLKCLKCKYCDCGFPVCILQAH